MDNLKIYLDLCGDWCRMAKDGKKDSDEAKAILVKADEVYHKLDDEQAFYADEQAMRIRMWFNI